MELSGDDLFRFCVFCGADCYEDEPQHADGCPSSTGVFPAEHLGTPDSDEIDAACCDCGAPFQPGGSYTLRRIDDNVFDVICLGCAAHGLIDA